MLKSYKSHQYYQNENDDEVIYFNVIDNSCHFVYIL